MFGCSLLSALIVLSRWTLIEPAEGPQHNSFAVAEVGGSFTLRCPVLDDNFIYWHKQSLGNKGQTVATGVYGRVSLQGEFNNKRFNITKEDSQFVLTIRNVRKEDEATYICLSGTSYSLILTNNIYLAVKDPNKEKCVYVKQHPKTESVVPGNSVNLQCSLHSKTEENKVQCPGEHSVYWFRAGAGESSLSLVYTQNHRTEEKETSCGYSLSRTIQDSSDAGTYYCAVVTCGRILFGEGTNVETRPDPVVLGLLLVLLACSVSLIALLIVCVKRRRFCEHCKEAMNASLHPEHGEPAVDPSTNLGGDAETENYVALDFSAKTKKKTKRRRETPEECVYSAVRA